MGTNQERKASCQLVLKNSSNNQGGEGVVLQHCAITKKNSNSAPLPFLGNNPKVQERKDKKITCVT